MRAREDRRRVIGVMGSGVERHEDVALPLGRWIAGRGFHLLTGGGAGVMEAVGEGFASVPDREGLSIGVLPAGPPPGYPNRWVDIAIQTHLAALGEDGESPASRNHLNVLSSDVVVALPGGAGTRSEVALAVRYGKPLLRLEPRGLGAEAVARASAMADIRGASHALATIEALLDALERMLPR